MTGLFHFACHLTCAIYVESSYTITSTANNDFNKKGAASYGQGRRLPPIRLTGGTEEAAATGLKAQVSSDPDRISSKFQLENVIFLCH